MARISIVGLGRVGLATGVAFAKLGHEVACYEVDASKVDAVRGGRSPYREKILGEELRKVLKKGNFRATDNAGDALVGSECYFICVGTPPLDDGSMDTRFMTDASKGVGRAIKGRKDFPVITVKSTVVPGTTEKLVAPMLAKESGLSHDAFGLCMNPEFLREGTALEDTLKPDRIIIGSNEKRPGDVLEQVYSRFESVKWRCDIKTAEMVKYATNSFLATKVTFANEIANVCASFGLDSDKVLEGIGLDSRINPKFLVPGAGFGGPCLPKDMKAIISASKSLGYKPLLLEAVLEFNERQAARVVDMLERELSSLDGKRIALLGLAFKAETDDVRDSRALPIIHELLRRGATIVAHDPAATIAAFGTDLAVKQVSGIRDALENVDGCIIQTSWREYKELDKEDFAMMKHQIIVDGRRTLDGKKLPKGVIYRRIG